jgi:uncharacterized membrane protein YphA (DoxX/SURF4 family)
MANGRAGRVILWIFQGWAAFAFVVIGFGKFHGAFWVKAFTRWGYSDGFRLLIGVLEMTGGLLMAFPRTAAYAAILLDVIMIGAIATLVAHDEHLFAPTFWLIVVSIVGYARWRQAWRPAAGAPRAHAGTV